jgi:hypothetical protein
MIVLMADIVGSSEKNAAGLMADFRAAVKWVNKKNGKMISSPLTITLGDEFQGLVKNTEGVFTVIFDLERYLLKLKNPFKLRYVVNDGAIETPVNKDIAYGMLGPGLTQGRTQLNSMKTTKDRFSIELANQHLARQLALAMSVYQGIADGWTPAQQKVVSVFWEENADYRRVAKKLKKDPTVMWKRKRSLMIEETDHLKKLIFLIINPAWEA